MAAVRDWALDDQDRLMAALGRPASLCEEEEHRCCEVEGWVVGAR